MFKLLAAASLASLPVCTIDGSPVDSETLAEIESRKIVPLDDDPFDASDRTFLGPGTAGWVRCVEQEIESLTEKRLQFEPNKIAAAAVDACVLEADGYRSFVAKVADNPKSPEIDASFERMRIKMIRFYSAIEVARRAGYQSSAMPAPM